MKARAPFKTDSDPEQWTAIWNTEGPVISVSTTTDPHTHKSHHSSAKNYPMLQFHAATTCKSRDKWPEVPRSCQQTLELQVPGRAIAKQGPTSASTGEQKGALCTVQITSMACCVGYKLAVPTGVTNISWGACSACK